MPTPAGPDTNQFHCEFCGRWFNEEHAFRDHQIECRLAHEATRGATEGVER